MLLKFDVKFHMLLIDCRPQILNRFDHAFSKPRFLDSHVQRIEMGWDETKQKAQGRLDLLVKTKAAWEGYAEGLEQIASEFEKADDEIKKVKKRFHLQSALEDLEKRQKIFNDTKNVIETMYKEIQNNYDIMTMTLPDDKKDFVKKEVKAITEKLECVAKFEEKVKKIEDFVTNLKDFDGGLKNIDKWMQDADTQLKDIKEASDKMTPEDRVSFTMELQEDVAAKVKIVKEMVAKEGGLLPQGKNTGRGKRHQCCHNAKPSASRRPPSASVRPFQRFHLQS